VSEGESFSELQDAMMPASQTTETRKQSGSHPELSVRVEPGDEDLGLTELLRECLDRPVEVGGAETWKHRLITILLRKAEGGDLKAIQEIWTRLEGKPGLIPPTEPDVPEMNEDLALRILRAAGEDEEDDVVPCREDEGDELLAEEAEG